MYSRTLYLIQFPLFTLLIFSNGAFGSEKSIEPNDSAAIIKLTSSNIRTYHQGDTISYTSIVAGSGVAMTGLLKQSIGTAITNPTGKQCLQHNISTTYTGVGGPAQIDFKLLYHQDNHNSLYECGYYDDKTSSYVFISDTANTPGGVALSIESPLKVGNATSNLITYTDGTWKDCTRSVVSIDTIETAAGTYEAYRITETCSQNAENSQTNTDSWFVPSLYTIKESGISEMIKADFVISQFVFN